jgi:hypothetical protein
MTYDSIHTCSYSCERPACIKAQRDELAQRLLELVAEAVTAEREEILKLADSLGWVDSDAIRARGNK